MNRGRNGSGGCERVATDGVVLSVCVVSPSLTAAAAAAAAFNFHCCEGGIARSSVPTALRRSLATAPPHPVPPPPEAASPPASRAPPSTGNAPPNPLIASPLSRVEGRKGGWLRGCLTAHIPRATEYTGSRETSLVEKDGDKDGTRERERERERGARPAPNKGGQREWEESNPRRCRGPSGGRLRAAIACLLTDTGNTGTAAVAVSSSLAAAHTHTHTHSLHLFSTLLSLVILASCYLARFAVSRERSGSWLERANTPCLSDSRPPVVPGYRVEMFNRRTVPGTTVCCGGRAEAGG